MEQDSPVPAPARFILNLAAKVAHDGENLSERCNTDQLAFKERSETVPEGYSLCQHCLGQALTA